jgi:hypothetical protein
MTRLDCHDLHHHDIVYFALKEVEQEIAEGKGDMVIHRLRRYLLERENRPNY